MTAFFMRRTVAGALTLLLWLAVPHSTFGASAPLIERPPGLQLLLSPAEPAITLPPLTPSDQDALSQARDGRDAIGLHRALSDPALEESLATNLGQWLETSLGSVWRLRISSPSAAALRVHIQNAALGEGHLWIYGDSDSVFGPYTGTGLYPDGEFWSPTVLGESLTLEYRPANGILVAEEPPFGVDKISHMWVIPSSAAVVSAEPVNETRDMTLSRAKRSKGESEVFEGAGVSDYRLDGVAGNERIVISKDSVPSLHAGTYLVSPEVSTTGKKAEETLTVTPRYHNHVCYIDLACRPEWVRAASAVAKIHIEQDTGYSGQCSGVLLNDRSSSGTPYFLTAAHCVGSESEARSIEVHWYFQNAACNATQFLDSRWTVTHGAELLVVEDGSIVPGSRSINVRGAGDVALLRLRMPPPQGVAYLGWNANRKALTESTNVVGIHHTENLAKKISFGRVRSRLANMTDIQWSNGFSLGGASGSPLINESGEVLGVLSAGGGGEGCFYSGNTYYSNFGSFYPRIRSFLERPPSRAVDSGNLSIATVVDVGLAGGERPVGLAVDTAGGLYVSGDRSSVRSVHWGSGLSVNVRGMDSGGRPGGLVPDPSNSSYVYVADWMNDVVWQWNTVASTMWRVAGTGFEGYFGDGGLAIGAWLDSPWALAVDTRRNLYVGEFTGGRVREVNLSTGTITTVLYGLGSASGLTIDATGNLFVSDSEYDVVWRWNRATGQILKVAGTGQEGYSGDGGPATAAQLNTPYGMALDASGNLYIADAGNHSIRRVNAASGIITTVAGTGVAGFSGDGGPATVAQLNTPVDVAIDWANNVYVADFGNGVVRRLLVRAGDSSTLGGPLVSGVPKRFELRPNSARTIQNGDRSYTINVPSSARRLTLTLATDNPRVDVDLYARFGRDNLANQWDWRSVGPTGNERIVLGLGTDSILWAGKYYISLMLYDDTGIPVTGSLTAILE